MILSSIIPCFIGKTNIPFFVNLKKVFTNNRELILTSSLIVALLAYLALEFTFKTPILNYLTELNPPKNYDNIDFIIVER